MVEPTTHLVHTEACSLEESDTSDHPNGANERSADSSAVEHCFHTAGVGGSKPSPRTDRLSEMLANNDWRMRVEERFWPKVMKPLDWTSCWTWTGARKRLDVKQSYGSFKLRSHCVERAHRVSYALYYGRSPGELFVCHTCDNPQCVNPSHLFLGTVQDNSADMVRKGRSPRRDQAGDKNGAAKLSADQVGVIRGLINAGLTNIAIAARFGVTHQLISRIRRGRAWGQPAMQPKYASLRR